MYEPQGRRRPAPAGADRARHDRCLARDGYSGLTLKTVAREARVSQGILHYYFADKRAILVAALAAVMADLDRRVRGGAGAGPREPRARLRALLTACLAMAAKAREFWVVFVEFWGEMMHDRRLREINAAPLQADAPADRRARRPGGGGRDVPPGRRSCRQPAVVLALVDGVSLQLTFDPKAFGVATAVRFCEDALMRYLEKEAR